MRAGYSPQARSFSSVALTSAQVGPEPNPLVPGLEPGALSDGRSGRHRRLLLPQHTGGCARLRSALPLNPPGTYAMITDAAVEPATAVLEERGWERDEEMVQDVRAALEAVQAEDRRQARWRHVP